MNVNPITLEALMVLDAIEHRGSFAAAAEQLNKVPSALSYVIQKLEEQIGVTLFQKQGRRSVLTPAGKHLLEEGRKLLFAVNTLTEQTRTIANGWESNIRISIDSIVNNETVFNCFKQFLDKHQNIEIDVCEQVMNGGWELLIEDKVDLVIGAPAPIPAQKGIRVIKIGHLQNVLVAQPEHEICQVKGSFELADLKKYRTVVVHDSANVDIPWTVNVIEGSQHFYVTSVAQKLMAIKMGIGIGYLPSYLVSEYINSGQLVAIELEEDSISTDIYIGWKFANKGLGLKSLREILEQQFRLF